MLRCIPTFRYASWILTNKIPFFILCSSITGRKSFTSLSRTKITPKKQSPSWNSTISHLIRNNRLDEARRLFDKLPFPDIYLCTIMINGCFQNHEICEALHLFYKMPVRDIVSWNSMINGCLNCGKLDLARTMFDEMPNRNVISWTTIIDGYARLGSVEIAEELFAIMPGRDTAAWNSMLHGYCSNGRMKDAYKLFKEIPCPNVISWTTIIGGLDQNGESDQAVCMFRQMLVFGVDPTPSTFACVLTACAKLSDLSRGAQLHTLLVKSGNVFDAFVATSLVTLYSNCKQIDNSHKFFQENVHRDVALWTALITGYGSNGNHNCALVVFHDMLLHEIKPNQSTFTSVLNSCCGLESLDTGKQIHAKAVKIGLDLDVSVGNSLIVIYTKCGNIDDGVTVFLNIGKRNLVSWNSVIGGCAVHGLGLRAFEFYEHMRESGVQPDEITFVGLLTACSHSRMLEKGRQLFKMLDKDPSIEVKYEHYACMVDILGRSGNLEEAEKFIKNMSTKANSMVWLALLSACRVYSNIDVAERAASKIFILEPHSSAAYVLLSNIYASCGRWADASHIRRMMKERGIVKLRGSSWIMLKGSKHEFSSGGRSHPMSKEIYKKLDLLGGKLKELGYVSDRRFALHDVEDEQKEVMLSYHSERLAIAFGLISTVEGSALTVMKNLRVCGDCHSVIKLLSSIVRREIIVRDTNRFHHFRDGACSCGDYW